MDRVFGVKRSFRLDAGIEDLVLVLNKHSVRTTQSCEGHLDHGFSYPWVRIAEEDCGTLEGLLEAFYQRYAANYDRMLMIEHLLDDEYMLRPHGGILQSHRELSERAAKLKEYQREMQCFAELLSDRFFEGA